MSVFHVELKKVVDDSYPIEVGFALEAGLIEDLKDGLVGNIRKFAVITDSIVKDLYAQNICNLLRQSGYETDLFVFEAGEKSKTRETKAMLEDQMLEKGYRRDCCIIAVGGGVVTDLAGFLAGTYGRGVPFINYATTLLAAADASVGGKTAVDTPLATNLIGLFYQPQKVYLDIATWKTLPKEQIASGMAETIKHACMASREFFDFLKENISDILSIDRKACEYVAEENCKIKYHVVEQDERESGLREILNLGHTVGRALETVSGYRLSHGEAVSVGMIAQMKLSHRLGYMTLEQIQEVSDLLAAAGLPVRLPDDIDRDALVRKLYTDKKVKNGVLRFVVQRGIGDVVEFEKGNFATPVAEETAREIIMEL